MVRSIAIALSASLLLACETADSHPVGNRDVRLLDTGLTPQFLEVLRRQLWAFTGTRWALNRSR